MPKECSKPRLPSPYDHYLVNIGSYCLVGYHIEAYCLAGYYHQGPGVLILYGTFQQRGLQEDVEERCLAHAIRRGLAKPRQGAPG